MSLRSWESHIRHTHEDLKTTAWCGAALTQFDWAYVDLCHAAYSAPKDRIQPCRLCVKAATMALKGRPGLASKQ